MGGFLLLTDARGGAWCSAAAELAAESGISARAIQITEVADVDGSWARPSGISSGGAILVRPDAHVVYRCQTLVSDAKSALSDALRALMANQTPRHGGMPQDEPRAEERRVGKRACGVDGFARFAIN